MGQGFESPLRLLPPARAGRPTSLRPVRRLLAPLVALALALAACGGGEDEEPAEGAAAQTQPAGPEAQVRVPNAADQTSKPRVQVPDGVEPPRALRTRDLVPGDGPALRAGDQVTMQYVGVSWSDGEQFDSSWDRDQPFVFPLGAGQVIQGWDRGLVGMRVGGRRLLVIPPDLGYGAQGQPPDIDPNETLVFVVDALRVSRAP